MNHVQEICKYTVLKIRSINCHYKNITYTHTYVAKPSQDQAHLGYSGAVVDIVEY